MHGQGAELPPWETCARQLPGMSAMARELPFDPADMNVRASIQIARSRHSAPGQARTLALSKAPDR